MKCAIHLAVIVAALFLAACSDGVPHVEDPYNPVDTDGNTIQGTAFLNKYCKGKSGNQSCQKVQNVAIIDTTGRARLRGW